MALITGAYDSGKGRHLQNVIEQFAERIRGYYDDPLIPLSKQFMFRRPPTVGELQRPPQVLLLGNHSSGKSTFINFLLGTELQRTGVAPTDDGFTLITHGPVATELDGHAVVSNPNLPYEGLRHFGDALVSHIRLKLRPVELLQTVTLIDSPGMIDEAKAENGRGFDFPGVVRWFAERADLVVVFFDPDKPGTTGETLQVFRESLGGIDHKLLIVLNKVDQFQNLHDFARAYGALCWNLGKVIPRKDLPMIYNTFVPIEGKTHSALRLDDFEKARSDLIEELRSAPTRRMDNQITQMAAFAERLRLHASVLDEGARRFRKLRWQSYATLVLASLGSAALAVVTGMLIALAAICGVAALTAIVMHFVLLPRAHKRTVNKFDEIFASLHDHEMLMREHAEDLHAVWQEVRPHARAVAEKRGLQAFRKMAPTDRAVLNALIEEDIPALRSELYNALQAPLGDPDTLSRPVSGSQDRWHSAQPAVAVK